LPLFHEADCQCIGEGISANRLPTNHTQQGDTRWTNDPKPPLIWLQRWTRRYGKSLCGTAVSVARSRRRRAQLWPGRGDDAAPSPGVAGHKRDVGEAR